jgi:hypothetical protein
MSLIAKAAIKINLYNKLQTRVLKSNCRSFQNLNNMNEMEDSILSTGQLTFKTMKELRNLN